MSDEGRAGLLPPLRILEIAEGVAAPACGRLFAALGHDVIKCEAPGGDLLRRREPLDRAGCGFAFAAVNADKRSIEVDLETPAGIETVQGLLADADVVISDLAPRRATAVGLDVRRLRRRWPRLVVVSVTPFGLDDPLSDQPGDSLLAESYGGLAHMIGDPDREPLSLGGEQAEHAAAFAAFLGAMLALLQVDRRGSGDVVDVAICDVAAWLDWKSDITFAVTGGEPCRTGASAGRWRTVAASDGWVGIIFQPEQWHAVVELVGDPRLADPALADEATRQARASQWWPVIEEWARARSKREIYEAAQQLALAFGYSADMGDITSSAQLLARGFLAEGAPDAGRSSTGPLFHSAALAWLSGRAPAPGEHRGARWKELTAPGSAVPSHPVPPGAATSPGDRDAPLAGVRIVDLGTITAGAAVGRLLCDYGATVVKVESLDHPDSFRQWVVDGVTIRTEGSEADTSPMFDSNNAGKRGLTLDLTSEAGRAGMDRLVAGADVLIENFRVGVTQRLGIHFDRLQAVNTNLIYLSLSSQGQEGPEARYRSYGSTLDLLSGLASLTGYRGGRPIWSSVDVNYPDQLVSLVGAAVVVYCIARGVRGAHLDVAQRDVVCWTLSDRIAQHRATGEVAGPAGNRRPGRTPHDTYRCDGVDQWVAISCFTEAQRAALADLVGIVDPEAGDEQWWWDSQDHIDRVITSWTRSRSKVEGVRALRAADVPCAPVQSASERSMQPHFADRRVFLADGPRLKGFPFRLLGYAPPRPPPAPPLGDHDEVLLDATRPWG